MTQNHPAPWRVNKRGDLLDANGNWVSFLPDDLPDLLPSIVAAVNSHAALVAVLEHATAMNALQHAGIAIGQGDWSTLYQLCNAARGAMAESA